VAERQYEVLELNDQEVNFRPVPHQPAALSA
jgi:hypothetical protein